jgi:hypothetical protein
MDDKMQAFLATRREPAIWFRTLAQAVSNSRWGGLPSLPAGTEWPVNPDTRIPLHFIAQIDLAELPATPLPGCPFRAALPRQGMLFFFFDCLINKIDHDGPGAAPKLSRVLYAQAAGPARPAPENLPAVRRRLGFWTVDDDSHTFPATYLRAYVIDTFWVPGFFRDGGYYVRPCENGEDEEAKWQSIVKAVGEPPTDYAHDLLVPRSPPASYYTFPTGPAGTTRYNVAGGLQIFGAGSEWGIRGEEYTVRDKSKVLLLELPTEEGALQFWTETRQLRTMRFDQTWTYNGCS